MGGSELTPTTRHLSELMDKLKKHASSFIEKFGRSEQRLREIVAEFREITYEVRKMQERTDKVRRVGTGALGVSAIGMPIGLLAGGAGVAGAEAAGGAGVASAFLATLWPSAAAAAAAAAGASVIATAGTIGAVIATGSAIFVAGANVTKKRSESGSINKVKQLRKEFMEIVEPLKNDLEEIKKTCEELEQRSAERQAGITLTDMLKFQCSVSEQGSSDGVLSTMWKVFTPTASPEEDRKLPDSIIQSADLSQKVIDDLKKMKEELKDFRNSDHTRCSLKKGLMSRVVTKQRHKMASDAPGGNPAHVSQ
ncbi:uncharacterized protein LOC120545314 [Perca fluviatilis]|uniref:uncharacterized protein LOC120545314 n=1 Tax=Perca fluviatilis TaxID=8168 RepID=UPI0019652421|nr:uncharacterized protein LOC120545314 [Perca fluviatilis]